MRIGRVAALLFLAVPAGAHRLDEYLQAAILAVGKNQVQVELTLTPGVAVLPVVLAEMRAGQRVYAERVAGDLSLNVDGRPVKLQLLSAEFPEMDEMKAGTGEIRMRLTGEVRPGGGKRQLIFENRHMGRISAYLVNCLAPRDREIRIEAQNRNYSQSYYRLDYAQGGVSGGLGVASPWRDGVPLGLGGLVAFAWMALLRTRRVRDES